MEMGQSVPGLQTSLGFGTCIGRVVGAAGIYAGLFSTLLCILRSSLMQRVCDPGG